MKQFLLLAALAFAYPSFSQPVKPTLQSAIERIEKSHQGSYGENTGDIQVVILEHSIVSLKDWRKEMYDTYMSFRKEYNEELDSLLTDMKLADSVNGTHFADSMTATLVNTASRQTGKNAGFDRVAYLKNRYETEDPSIKVYKVLYRADYVVGGRKVAGDKLNTALYVKDMSEVKTYGSIAYPGAAVDLSFEHKDLNQKLMLVVPTKKRL